MMKVLASGAATAAAIVLSGAAGPSREAPDVLRQIGLPGPAFKSGRVDTGAPGFDRANTAYYRVGTTLFVRNGRRIGKRDFAAAAAVAINRDLFANGGRWDGGWDRTFGVDTNIVFDDRDVAYTVLTPRLSNLRNAVLLWSSDRARTWHAIRLAGITATIEARDGFNDLSGPPSVLSHLNYGAQRGGRLWLETFRRHDDGAVRRALPAVLVTGESLLAQKHSGAGNSSYSRGGRIFVVYPSAVARGGGTASYIREFDERRNAFTAGPRYLGNSTTRTAAPDNHDFPVVTGDRAGKLTVVIGGHHAPFLITSSQKPLTAGAGWTDPAPVGTYGGGGSYTYPSLNTTPDQAINIFARQEDPRYAFDLVQLRKPFGQGFQTWRGAMPFRVIAASPRRFYVVWRQRVTMDRNGALYLNFRYEPNQLDDAEARQLKVDRASASACRIGRCFYTVTSKDGVTLVSRDSGRTFARY